MTTTNVHSDKINKTKESKYKYRAYVKLEEVLKDFQAILDRVQDGEIIVIKNNGKLVAEMKSVSMRSRGLAKGDVVMSEDFDDPMLKQRYSPPAPHQKQPSADNMTATNVHSDEIDKTKENKYKHRTYLKLEEVTKDFHAILDRVEDGETIVIKKEWMLLAQLKSVPARQRDLANDEHRTWLKLEEVMKDFQAILDRVQDGEVIVIKNKGKLDTEMRSVPMRPHGLAKGDFVVPEDFDDPLPEYEFLGLAKK